MFCSVYLYTSTYTNSAGSDAVLFLDQADANKFKFGTGSIYDAASRSTSVKLTLTQTGNLGIGTTAPGAKLEVAGQIKITGGTPGAGKILTSDATGLATWQTYSAATSWGITGNAGTIIGTHFLGTTDTAPLEFRAGGNRVGYLSVASNVSMGYLALSAAYTGSAACTAVGNFALSTLALSNLYNTAIGESALDALADDSRNTAIGSYSLSGSTSPLRYTALGASIYITTNRSNVTALGYGISDGECTGNSQVLLGNSAVTQIRAQVGTITAYSDARFKTNVNSNVKGLDFITRLNPVSYNIRPKELHKIWETPESLLKTIDFSETENTRQIGFIAQEVEKAAKEAGFDFPGLEIPKNDKQVYSLRYTDFVMPLVQAMKELKAENDAIKAELPKLEKAVEKLLKED